MADGTGGAKARCVNCREEVAVSDEYTHGDLIKCGTCGTQHKVVRGDRLRLVLADVTPLREALAQNEQLITRLSAELAHARTRFGIGANGFGIGLVYALYQVGWKGDELSASLLANAVGIALVSGFLLEAANWAFLAKRSAITRLSAEIAEAEAEGSRIRALIREATRF